MIQARPSAGLLVSGKRPTLLSWRSLDAMEATKNGLMEDPGDRPTGIGQHAGRIR